METGITVSILTHNRKGDLLTLLRELHQLKYRPLKIIVIDNCSIDGTEEMVQNDFPIVKYIRSVKNVGADARNLGLKRAETDIVITLDDDVRGITDSHLKFVMQTFQMRETVGAINFRIVDAHSGKICNWVHHCKRDLFSEKEFNTYEITEGAVAFRRRAVQDAGYYPDGFFLSHEGPDLALRLLDRGYEVIYSCNVTVRHSHSQLGRRSWTNYYYDTRNLFFLAIRNFPIYYAAIYLSRGLMAMLIYSLRDQYFKYWIKGVAHGLRGIRTILKDRKVLCHSTMKEVIRLDRERPSIFDWARERLLTRGARL